MVFSLQRELREPVFQSCAPVHDPYLPSSSPLLPALNECGGNLAKAREKMKTFLKWHVPVAERRLAEPAGKQGRFPVHPLNILSMFSPPPQNHSNVFLPSPPPSDPGSARRAARRKVPEAPRLPREGPQPAWRLAGLWLALGFDSTSCPASGRHSQRCFPG